LAGDFSSCHSILDGMIPPRSAQAGILKMATAFQPFWLIFALGNIHRGRKTRILIDEKLSFYLNFN
jgi:hypothetical protein